MNDDSRLWLNRFKPGNPAQHENVKNLNHPCVLSLVILNVLRYYKWILKQAWQL
uniref:Uncharacterized protein n=1 Tax=Anguilla anguilla TaxID=7936 RepID=A0A0E9SZ39_ANGAN